MRLVIMSLQLELVRYGLQVSGLQELKAELDLRRDHLLRVDPLAPECGVTNAYICISTIS